MTRWKRESVARYGAADACRIHYAVEQTPRGWNAATLELVGRLRRHGWAGGPERTLLRLVRERRESAQ